MDPVMMARLTSVTVFTGMTLTLFELRQTAMAANSCPLLVCLVDPLANWKICEMKCDTIKHCNKLSIIHAV